MATTTGPTKQELMDENEDLLDLLEDIDDAVNLPCALQERLDSFFEPDEDEDDDEDDAVEMVGAPGGSYSANGRHRGDDD